MAVVDAALLTAVVLVYGVGDLGTALYGLSRYGLAADAPALVFFFGDRAYWYRPVARTTLTLGGLLGGYLLTRVLYAARVARVLWWVLGGAALLRGIRRTAENWRAVRNARRTGDR